MEEIAHASNDADAVGRVALGPVRKGNGSFGVLITFGTSCKARTTINREDASSNE